ncbi:hypothetical protein [Aquabacterium sp. A08]|uniref:hypothetical protein n=1 Tax=Aquabacterium sp. A08 TaxID=2718532 RepID=UPI00141E6D1E|nr:hypothetical protein [Aquabacterium sp. A08]NIC42212.1 hypothetical protein [Aquabacterium sp. A08]
MHIAIDDTYGPEIATGSSFVTGDRRTHVAVVFPDEDVQDIRRQAAECLAEIAVLTGVVANEFHFVDIYNRKSPWDKLPDQANLRLFEFFASIYKHYRWPVLIQTIDTRTLGDHGIGGLAGIIDGLDLSDRADLSLVWLLIKLKIKFKKNPEPITLFIDEGRKKPGTQFGSKIFHDWQGSFSGCYSSSAAEPLLQVADFMAFCINRSTHLAMKSKRSDVDSWFLNLVGGMRMDCDDLKLHTLPKNFSVVDFDGLHVQDRVEKGL